VASSEIDRSEAFQQLTGFPIGRWQRRLLDMLLSGEPPPGVALPTGIGKTSVMTLWLIARGFGAALPRRLVYVVDRRVVVDQASREAEALKNKLAPAVQDPLLRALRQGLGLGAEAELPVSSLRGGLADDAAWRLDPAASAIIVGTVDMIGSRLLFEGYGVSRRMRPLQAGLLGCDALVVLDEAHLVPPFAALMRSIVADASPRGSGGDGMPPGLRLMTLSATGREASDARIFRLEPEEAKEKWVAQRLDAGKCLRIAEPVPRKELPARLAERARALAGSDTAPARVIVFCDQRRQAQEVAQKLATSDVAVHLLVGERRGHERRAAVEALEKEGFLAGSEAATKRAVLVATAAGEVGVDLDADHMVGDVVAFERMVQRLGRVNRRGEKREAIVELIPVETEAKAGSEEARREARAAATLELLRNLPKCSDGDGLMASPAALQRLQEDAALAALRAEATTPEPLRPALTHPLVEAWSLTGLPEHTGRPEIAPWLRGWVEDEPEVRLFWRRILPWREGEKEPDRREVNAFFGQAPPALPEVLEAPLWRAIDVLKARAEALRRAGMPGVMPAILVLDTAQELERGLTLGEVAKLDARRDAALAGRYLAVAACLGGLSEEGLLDEKSPGVASDAPSSARGVGCTADAPEGMPGVPHRFTQGPPEAADPPEEGWVEAHAWPLTLDAEGAPERMLRIWTREPARADPALTRRAQTLADHAAAVEGEVVAMARRLGLPGPYCEMLRLAARCHDAGKAAERWQDAFSAPKDGRPYAKTAARRVNQARLGHYRHEFGSLAEALREPALAELPADLRDLALHLIAAHHGRARPVIDGRDAPLMPSAAEAIAREAALRFARLQRRFGPWGLAWWEALLRCADAAASAKLERG